MPGALRDELIDALAPAELLGGPLPGVRDLAYDTRAVTAGALFFCVPGARVDGHDLAGEAVAGGAAVLVVERPLDLAVPQVLVPSSRAAMAPAADVFFGRPTRELPVAGVTGTNGKTTVAYLLHSILDAAGWRPGLLGTIERRVGDEVRPAELNTPEAIDLQRLFREMLDAGNRSCAMEATSEASAQGRLDRTRFAVLVFTNLTQDHLDFHGTMELYFQAKRRLFTEGEPPPAAINFDDQYGRRLADELRRRGEQPVLTYGLGGDADLSPKTIDVPTSLRGRFNLENVLGAAAGARLLGVPDEAIRRGVAAVESVPGRFELVDEGQPFAVVVDYSHTPDSLENALREARGLADGRVLCVFGCGGDRDHGKRPLMGRIADELADVAILTSDNPRREDPLAIIADVLSGAPGLDVEPDRAAAIERAIEQARAGDVVLIAGKGDERGQRFRDRTLPFDDREASRQALRRLAAKT